MDEQSTIECARAFTKGERERESKRLSDLSQRTRQGENLHTEDLASPLASRERESNCECARCENYTFTTKTDIERETKRNDQIIINLGAPLYFGRHLLRGRGRDVLAPTSIRQGNGRVCNR